MDQALNELTDKEKQTLRLIVRGHDAKSMAAELDLSVHTINERLRVARRKLGVTSSREAARLLFDSESGAYENFVGNSLGEERSTDPGEAGGVVTGKRARRPIAGVLAMITLFAAGLILTSHFADAGDELPAAEASATDQIVAEAARDWLEMIDNSDWQSSFDAAGSPFREANTVEGWATASRQVRQPLGAVLSRELLTIRFLNAPPRGYQEVAFATRFVNDERVIETVTLQEEDGVWKPVGILID
jgi:DNA-binding CsgD family transcriptional regulator